MIPNSFDTFFSSSLKKYRNYKCDNPRSTIHRIKNILGQIGLQTKETSLQIHPKLCLSVLRTTDYSVQLGSGKGISKDLSLASCYAETLERIQNAPLSFFGKSGLTKTPLELVKEQHQYPDFRSTSSQYKLHYRQPRLLPPSYQQRLPQSYRKWLCRPGR